MTEAINPTKQNAEPLDVAPSVIPTLEDFVDLDRYPIHDTASPVRQALIEQCRQELDAVGCCRISDIIRPESIERMRQEVERQRANIYWSEDSHNPYMTKEDLSLPKEHPARFFAKRSSGFVNSDILEEFSDLRAIYNNDVMLQFISDCLGVAPLYRWADPLGCNPYSVMDEGNYFPWHFDGNEFTVSILVQEPEKGGEFQYCPDLRTSDNENLEAVTQVLKGDPSLVHSLALRPGDMQIFKGRFSMHRVTPVEGKRSRYIALPTYMRDPDTVNRPEHARQFYGRALPIHHEREANRPDSLLD
ncbi:hypothetical protein Q4488_08075 [Amphritea sp. 1_MG-2023]|uniref:HalD/BesD family halogenase n=1 Tax=Amphritea sp. 1_MG-2023 TaxID=3062670 RepID=UPI0026E2075C|nr:hypothetical protein [Amphritea sp. 1_MG-2023]MDO6563339.1 hypothetical protein [Amphritea sp. 1_MG-2023]